ncbi:MAG: DUF1831 domain-containing protein [Liquorilactobacillus sp.]|uniref:DUF1831 domain-containing protein n=1 Tax=Liquorilactobacillus sp. TaxID=2767923 RepID=UPI0039EA8BC2
MAYTKEAKILGDNRVFALSTEIKKYTLRDVGFLESKGGKFILERPLDPTSPYNASIKLKVTISSDLQTFKIGVTSANGLKEINISKGSDVEKHVEQLNFVIDNLKERAVLIEK